MEDSLRTEIVLFKNVYPNCPLPHTIYPTNATDPFKSASDERNKWVRYGHLNALYSHVQA